LGLNAVYPGTFDPLTNGHLDIIERAIPFFDSLHIVVAENSSKSGNSLFTIQERLSLIREVTKDEKKIVVTSFSGLVVNYARKVGAKAIVRGLRAVSDFDYEFQMATMNRRLASGIETIFFATRGKYFYLNSSMVKNVASLKGDISAFVPSVVEEALVEKFRKKE
jgi:pantetheine-phosphate adenylyltransferase